MKKNNKGFFLSELIIVTSVILLASITLYTQTNTIIKNNQNKERYNSVDGIYRAKNIKDYLFRFGKIGDLTAVGAENIQDITTSYSDSYFIALTSSSNIEKILFIKQNTSEEYINNYATTGIDKDFKRFLKWVSINKMNNASSPYRLVINYKDNGRDYYSIIEVDNESE